MLRKSIQKSIIIFVVFQSIYTFLFIFGYYYNRFPYNALFDVASNTDQYTTLIFHHVGAYLIGTAVIFSSFFFVRKLVLFIYKKFKITPKETFDSIVLWQNDCPIETPQKDLLDVNSYAVQLAETITQTDSSLFPFYLSLEGEVGIGKTSFVNLVCHHINQNRNDWLTIHAPFYRFKDGTDVYQFLLQEIGDTTHNLSALRDTFENVISYTTPTAKGLLNLGNRIWDNQNQWHSLHSQFKKVLGHRKLLIAIDDIDRLPSTDIVSLLRLIRETLNFSQIVFIVVYSRELLEANLGTVLNQSPREYLDRVFDLVKPLPYPCQKLLQKLINQSFQKSSQKKKNKNNVQKELFSSSTWNQYIVPSILNIRGLKQFFNFFYYQYAFLTQPVNKNDFAFISSLAVFYPDTYQFCSNLVSEGKGMPSIHVLIEFLAQKHSISDPSQTNFSLFGTDQHLFVYLKAIEPTYQDRTHDRLSAWNTRHSHLYFNSSDCSI